MEKQGNPLSPGRLWRDKSAFFLRDDYGYAAKLQGGESTNGICLPFWAFGHQALASESNPVQVSRTIIFGGLTLTGFIAAQGRFVL